MEKLRRHLKKQEIQKRRLNNNESNLLEKKMSGLAVNDGPDAMNVAGNDFTYL